MFMRRYSDFSIVESFKSQGNLGKYCRDNYGIKQAALQLL